MDLSSRDCSGSPAQSLRTWLNSQTTTRAVRAIAQSPTQVNGGQIGKLLINFTIIFYHLQ